MKTIIIVALCVATVYGKAIRFLEGNESEVFKAFEEQYGTDAFHHLKATLEEFLNEVETKTDYQEATTQSEETTAIETTAFPTEDAIDATEATTVSEDVTTGSEFESGINMETTAASSVDVTTEMDDATTDSTTEMDEGTTASVDTDVFTTGAAEIDSELFTTDGPEKIENSTTTEFINGYDMPDI